jgi:hypothetical protein
LLSRGGGHYSKPRKSERAIAEEIGVSESTVLRARRKSTTSHEAVAKRTGKDGKRGKCRRKGRSAGDNKRITKRTPPPVLTGL